MPSTVTLYLGTESRTDGIDRGLREHPAVERAQGFGDRQRPQGLVSWHETTLGHLEARLPPLDTHLRAPVRPNQPAEQVGVAVDLEPEIAPRLVATTTSP